MTAVSLSVGAIFSHSAHGQSADQNFENLLSEAERAAGDPDLSSEGFRGAGALPPTEVQSNRRSRAKRRRKNAASPTASADQTLEALLRGDREADAIIAAARHSQRDGDTLSVDEAYQLPRDRAAARQRLRRGNTRQRPTVTAEELFAPLGIRRGGFIFFPEVAFSGIYTDNLFSTNSHQKDDDGGLEITPGLRMRSNWARHELSLDARGHQQFLNNFQDEEERVFSGAAAGRLDIRRKTQLSARGFIDLDTESRESQQLPDDAAERTQTSVSGLTSTLQHRFNRLTLALRGAATQYDYDDVRLNNGQILNNGDRNYLDKLGGLRASYEFSPKLTVFADGSINRRSYEQRVDDSGFRRGSEGVDIRGGFELEYSAKLRARVAIGYALQNQDDRLLDDVRATVYDAELEYKPSALTTILLRAASGIDEALLFGTAGTTRQVQGFDISHALRRHVVVTFGMERATTNYVGIRQGTDSLTTRIGADYYLSREVLLGARYEHSNSKGSDPEDDYVENKVKIGMTLRR